MISGLNGPSVSQYVADVKLIIRSFYTGIVIHSLEDDGSLGPEKEVHGFPEGSKINFVSW